MINSYDLMSQYTVTFCNLLSYILVIIEDCVGIFSLYVNVDFLFYTNLL